MRFRTVAAFAAGVMIAAAGTAYATTKASIVGSDNQIHGCYLQNAGLLRVVDEGTACRDNEQSISWDAHGGPTGPQGPAGPTGPAGPKGDPGAKWRGAWSSTASYNDGDIVRYADGTWIKGNPNYVCRIGACDTGPPNANRQWVRFTQDGATGPMGSVGLQGPAGPAGPAGPQGPAGPAGPAGTGTLESFGVDGPKKYFCGALDPSPSCAGLRVDETSIATCPNGSVVTGGRAFASVGTAVEDKQGNGWAAAPVGNDAFSGGWVQATAVCLRLK